MEDIGIGGGEGGLKDRPGPSGQTVAETAAMEDINIGQAPVYTPYKEPAKTTTPFHPSQGSNGGGQRNGSSGGMGKNKDPGGGTAGSPF